LGCHNVIIRFDCVHSNTNLLDDMVLLLEKYTTQLEGQVERRTLELVDVKKKTEMLLHRMLPRLGLLLRLFKLRGQTCRPYSVLH
jgi:hypothetical protein